MKKSDTSPGQRLFASGSTSLSTAKHLRRARSELDEEALDVAAIVRENERLREQNAKFRKLQAQRSIEREEVQDLRSRAAVLEEKLGSATGSSSSALGVATPQIAPSPRSRYTKTYDVKGWETERGGQKQAASRVLRKERSDSGVEPGPVVASSDAVSSSAVVSSSGVGPASIQQESADNTVPLMRDLSGESVLLSQRSNRSSGDAGENDGTLRVLLEGTEIGERQRCSWIRRASLVGPSAPLNIKYDKVWLSQRDGLGDMDESSLKQCMLEAYLKHLDASDSPYLSFSALLPQLFGALCAKYSDQTSAARSSDSVPASRNAFKMCAKVIRHVIKESSPFDGDPPETRPEAVPKQRYVREMSAQVGLALDLVRLGFVQRLTMLAHAKASQPSTPRQQPCTPQFSAPKACHVDTKETEVMLKRAALYLSSISKDMTDLREEAQKRIQRERAERIEREKEQEAQKAAEKVARIAAEQASKQAAAQAIDQTIELPVVQADEQSVEDNCQQVEGEAHEEMISGIAETQQLVATCAETQIDSTQRQESALVLASDGRNANADSEIVDSQLVTGGALAAEDTESGNAQREETVDPLLTPAFGDFISKQLLPLYVMDIPFDRLHPPIEEACGNPLDSDDEEDALKFIGRKHSDSARYKRRLQRRLHSAHSTASGGQKSPSSDLRRRALPVTDFSDLVREAQGGARGSERLRPTMENSVAERRWKGHVASGHNEVPHIRSTMTRETGAKPAPKQPESTKVMDNTPRTKAFMNLASSRSLSQLLASPAPSASRSSSIFGKTPVSTRANRVSTPSSLLGQSPFQASAFQRQVSTPSRMPSQSPVSTRAHAHAKRPIREGLESTRKRGRHAFQADWSALGTPTPRKDDDDDLNV